MASITESITIRRSPDDVFAFVSNYENDPRWRDGVAEMQQDPPGPARDGARTREVIRFMGRDMVTTAVITVEQPGRRIAFRADSGPIPARGYREVAGRGDETTFTYHLSAELNGPLRLMEPVIERDFRRRVAADLARIKGLLEAKCASN
jgi:hypothetical protein